MPAEFEATERRGQDSGPSRGAEVTAAVVPVSPWSDAFNEEADTDGGAASSVRGLAHDGSDGVEGLASNGLASAHWLVSRQSSLTIGAF